MCESKPTIGWKNLPWTRCNSHQGMHKHIPMPSRYFTNVKESFCLLSDAPSRLSKYYSQLTYLGILSPIMFCLTDSPPLFEQYTVMGCDDILPNARPRENFICDKEKNPYMIKRTGKNVVHGRPLDLRSGHKYNKSLLGWVEVYPWDTKLSALSNLTGTLKISSSEVKWIHRWRIDSRRVQ